MFREIYGAYYNAVAKILGCAVRGTLDMQQMKRICDEKAFAESSLVIIPALTKGKWQLLRQDMSTVLQHEPSQPLTGLQLRWLKSVSLDPRAALFGLDLSFLDGIEPLYRPEDIVIFDKYADGDPYDDEHYIEVFRTALCAVKTGKTADIAYNSAKGSFRRFRCRPIKLEYSEKDDKFRLAVEQHRKIRLLKLSRIERIELSDSVIGASTAAVKSDKICCAEAELIDERKALERAMLHFAHFERETTKLSDDRYKLKIYYNASDETELVIRILSFGPLMRVTAPDTLVQEIRNRLTKQYEAGVR